MSQLDLILNLKPEDDLEFLSVLPSPLEQASWHGPHLFMGCWDETQGLTSVHILYQMSPLSSPSLVFFELEV